MDGAVKELLALKEKYKKLTGVDYKPASASTSSSSNSAQKENKKPASAPAAAASATTTTTSAEAEQLLEKITKQGDKVRELKANKSAAKVS